MNFKKPAVRLRTRRTRDIMAEKTIRFAISEDNTNIFYLMAWNNFSLHTFARQLGAKGRLLVASQHIRLCCRPRRALSQVGVFGRLGVPPSLPRLWCVCCWRVVPCPRLSQGDLAEERLGIHWPRAGKEGGCAHPPASTPIGLVDQSPHNASAWFCFDRSNCSRRRSQPASPSGASSR